MEQLAAGEAESASGALATSASFSMLTSRQLYNRKSTGCRTRQNGDERPLLYFFRAAAMRNARLGTEFCI